MFYFVHNEEKQPRIHTELLFFSYRYLLEVLIWAIQ